jgi:amino-acid N-acetyltransferase
VTDVRIEDAATTDADAVLEFVSRAGLPTDGLVDHLGTTLVARRDGRIIATAALELYADGGLLRSVAVDPLAQARGLGHRMTEAAIARARARGLPAIYLLTTTAATFFPRLGFVEITRDDVPASVRASIEFTSACPASAVVMRKSLI